MSEESPAAKGGVGKWFLKKFFSAPAAWVGLLAGTGSAIAFANEGPGAGAIGFGTMVGLAAGIMCWGLLSTIHTLHRADQQSALSAGGAATHAREQTLLGDLRSAGRTDDADLLEKMCADRDAILKRCQGREDDADAAHTMELASAIVTESCRQVEELQDLVRRAEDPLLDGPEGAEIRIEGIRENLKRAYQAVANARSRLRRGERLREADFLADSASLASLDLGSLASQLEEETAISKRVEERLRPDRADWMIDDEEIDSTGGEELREYE